MKKNILLCCVFISIALFSSLALAQPNLEITTKAEKETSVVKNGKKISKLMPVKKVTSGETIQYAISYKNTGTEEAKNAVISDPIPDGTIYVPGTASETGELTFSIDGGKSFKKPSLLSYEIKGVTGAVEKRTASPDEYTHIRWVIDSIKAGESGMVKFKVKVK